MRDVYAVLTGTSALFDQPGKSGDELWGWAPSA